MPCSNTFHTAIRWQRTLIHRAVLACLATCLAACNGDYSGGTATGEAASNTPTAGGGSFANSEAFFDARIAPRMDFCRTCHIPQGLADTSEGRRFLLSSNSGDDYNNLYSAWETLGGGVENNLLIIENADNNEPHSGGKNWPSGSDAYNDAITLLSCWENPAQCVFDTVGEVLDSLPLLGSSRGGHAWFDFCEGKTDSAALPVDPRARVQPGISDGKAVYFNAFWKDCHIDPQRVGEQAHPETCGELRASRDQGAILMQGNGVLGQGSFFAGEQPNGYAAATAQQFNSMWQIWGLDARPDNYEQLMAERYGFGENPVHSPYPLPNEDPNTTNGGSGQLPYGLQQTRNADGSWSGNIAANCNTCHSIAITGEGAPGFVVGGGGALFDASTYGRDVALSGIPLGAAIDRLGLGGRTRGTNNAQFDNIAALAGIADGNPPTPGYLEALTSTSTASNDTPAWWNVGHRPIKFSDAQLPADAVRADFAFFQPLLDDKPFPSLFTGGGPDAADEWVSEHVQAGDHWIMSVKAPAYPREIDTQLAEQGAILFHNKDLWADETTNPVPRPAGGNGSCASCHGAYSPRYVNDSSYLASPDMEGIASYMVPLEIIGTDPVRTLAYSDGTNEYLSRVFFGYPETAGTEQDCTVQNQPHLRGPRPKHGYAAPPLYGVWATAPYFHNGSVPNVREVLKPAERHGIWKRQSKPAPAGMEGQVVMGYDTSLDTGYDHQRMGWKYEALDCGAGTMPYFDCNPADPESNAPPQELFNLLYGNLILGWNLLPPPILTNEDVENRKIYNTRLYSQGNQGHDFSSILTDQEVTAIIEYLKTL